MSGPDGAAGAIEQLVAEAPAIAQAVADHWERARRRDNWTVTVGAEEKLLAGQLVELVAGVLADRITTDEAIAQSGDIGGRTAALGLSAADLVSWTRVVEDLAAEAFTKVVGPADAEAVTRDVSRWFDKLRAYQLDAYEAAHHDLAGWRNHVGTDLISYLTSGVPIDDEGVRIQARALGVDPDQQFNAIAVRMGPEATRQNRRNIRLRLSALFRQFQPLQSLLVHEQEDRLMAIIPTGTDDGQLLAALGDLLEEEELGRNLYVAVGEPVPGLIHVGTSCRQASSALEIAVSRGHRRRVTKCTDVLLEVLLTHNRHASRRLVDVRLSELADSPHLIETLRAYINCDMALQRTAEELFVHPNTVAYRLRQIGQRTDRDMRKVSDLIDLCVALAALDVVSLRAGDRDLASS